MKIDVYVGKLRQYKTLLENKDKILLPAVNATHATMLDRIFKDGEDVNNNIFGLYSSKELYIKVPYQGVSNSSLKKVGKKGKKTKTTQYLKGGYAEFRSKAGRQNSHVDLNLTGNMFLNMGISRTAKGSYLIGFKDRKYAERAEGFENKYSSKIFALSEKEEKIFITEINKEIKQIKKKLNI